MKLTTIALATAFALSSTFALAQSGSAWWKLGRRRLCGERNCDRLDNEWNYYGERR
jgi:hypothetical protein